MSDWKTLSDKLNLKLRPIDVWPGNIHRQRTASPFSASLSDTLSILVKELRALNASGIVLQIAIREGDLRLDGLPRANAIAEHPGIILAFQSKHGPLRLAFDGFPKWQHNLRAIAMHLEHLRLASLYGVGNDGEQYRGWTALPPPPPSSGPSTSDLTGDPEEAARYLWTMSGLGFIYDDVRQTLSDAEAARKLIRNAQQKAHPDTGGKPETFRRVQSAAAILKKVHGL
jgi:hypothetical protein